MPATLTQTELRDWLSGLEWESKPIKRLTTGVWLVGAAESPPRNACQCNSQVVLIEPVQSRARQASTQPVIAGKLVVPPKQKGEPAGPDPLQENDAWAQFRQKHGMSMGLQDPVKAPVQRDIEGPTASRLNDQDKKIEQMQQRLEVVAKMQQEHATKVSQTFEEVRQHSIQQDQKINMIDKNMQEGFCQQQKQQEQQMVAVKAAIESATKANEDQFKVLRDMLLKSNAGKTEPRKASKTVPGSSPLDSDREM